MLDSPFPFRLIGKELGCPLLCLAAPERRPPLLLDYTRTGSLFAMFLSCPLMALCLLCGEVDPTPVQLRSLQVWG